MRVKGIIFVLNPGSQFFEKHKRASPFAEPDELFFHGAVNTFRVGVALGIVVAGEGLMNPQLGANLHELLGGGLTAVVAHEVKVLPSGTVGELAVDGHIQGLEPMLCFRTDVGVVADDLLGIPVEDNNDVDPSEVLDEDLGHVDAPPLVGARGARLGFHGGANGLQAEVGFDLEVMSTHDAFDAFFVDSDFFNAPKEIGDSSVAPERVLGFDLSDGRQEVLIAQGDFRIGHRRPNSLFFNSMVNSPIMCFNRAFSRSRANSRRDLSAISKTEWDSERK